MRKQESLDNLKKELCELYFRNQTKMSDKDNCVPIMEYAQNFYIFLSRFHASIEDQECIKDLIARLKKDLTPKEKALLELSSALIYSEGIIFNFVDFWCYLLVLDGHDIYDVVRDKYVKTIGAIAKISISSKLKFLNHHGINLCKYVDLKFRNDIAHHNYFVDNNGDVLIEQKRVNVLSKLKNTHLLIQLISSFFKTVNQKEEKK